jgi:macrolide transport system ATP-binding/permease protein
MTLLTARNLSKAFGAIQVLHDVSFIIHARDRVGIIGPNGIGKSTLLKILVGQEELESGSFAFKPSIEVGYLPQTTPAFYGRSIRDLIEAALGNLRQLEERMRQLEAGMARADGDLLPGLLEEYGQVSTRFQDRGGYELDYKLDSILAGLRIDYLPRDQDIQTLSGGEKARLSLAILLLQAPDLLLLDEPTNHLDFASMEWLENYLANYRGAMMMVSHDRQFLNKVVNRIFELEEYNHQLKKYEGDYDAASRAKAAERLKWQEDYAKQQEELKELHTRIREGARQVGHTYRPPRDNDKFARHFFAQRVDSTVSRNIRAAEERLRRIEADPIPRPPEALRVNSHFRTEPLQSRIVLRANELSKSWGDRHILHTINLTITPEMRIILVGPNGTGKTTLLKLLMGVEVPTSGDVLVAPGARIGYLPQEPAGFDTSKTVLETYRYDQVGYEADFVAKLIGFGLFRLADMHKKVGQLSVGQKRKLEIARLMAQEPNVLLLDEPTNYISLDVLESFESALGLFQGPIIAISHDRWFIQRFAGTIWELADGNLMAT